MYIKTMTIKSDSVDIKSILGWLDPFEKVTITYTICGGYLVEFHNETIQVTDVNDNLPTAVVVSTF